jgi:uncharacterized protein YjgD (DUF1641 family)
MHTAPPRPESRATSDPTLDQRLARIERSLEKVDQLTTQIPLLMATVTEIADSQARRIPDLDDRLEKVVGLLERLTRPQTMRSLETLLDAVEQAPHLVSTAVDVVDDLMAKAAASGVHVESIVESTGQLLSGLFDLATSPEVRNLLESGMLDKGAVQTLGRAANALADVRCQTPQPVGVFGALRAIGDPDVQRALGFLVAVGTAFGHQLSDGPLCGPEKQLENGA